MLRLQSPFFALFCFLLLLTPSFLSAEELQGPSFSNPDYQVPMPSSWQEKGITYNKDVADADLVINLDQSENSLLAPVIKEYGQKNNLNIFVNSGTCGISNRMLMKKEVDIASFCCPPGKSDRLPGLKFHTLGITPIGLIVNPQNPIRNITLQEARKAFMGEINRWSGLNHDPKTSQYDHPIHPVAFIHCKKRPGHWRLILKDEELFSTRLKTVVTVPEMVQTISANPMALGYEIPGLVNHYSKLQGSKVTFLKLDGLDPLDVDTVATGNYPFYRTYNLAIWENSPNPHVAKLVKHLIAFVEQHGKEHYVVPVSQLRTAGWKFRNNELIGEAK